MTNKTIKRLLTVSMLALLAAPAVHAADPNAVPNNIVKKQRYSCDLKGWSIEITEFERGPERVRFQGESRITTVRRGAPSGWGPDPYYNPNWGPEMQLFSPIVYDPLKPNGGKVCASDMSVIGYDQRYYILTERSPYPWAHTQIQAMLEVENIIDLNPTQILEKFRGPLTRQASPNAGPLPSTEEMAGFCESPTRCFESNVPQSDNRRDSFQILDMLMHEMDADIAYYLGESQWGEHKEDLMGLSSQWISTLDSLGIANSAAIRENMKPRPGPDGGTFIFRKLESSAPISLIKIDFDDEEELHLIIRPSKTTNLAGTSWPTSNYVDQTQPPTNGMPGDNTPNPNYCAENSPRDPKYIPQYISDSNVILELGRELKYLTDDQMERIEEKGWKITEGLKNWTPEDWQNSIAENPRMRRLTHNCILQRDGSQPICETKDIAYYDALIDRMIVVNPVIGTLENHPCNKPRRLTGSVNENALSLMKSPAAFAVEEDSEGQVQGNIAVEEKPIEAAPAKMFSRKRLPIKTSE